MSKINERLEAARLRAEKSAPAPAKAAVVDDEFADAIPSVHTGSDIADGAGTSDAAVAAVLDNIGILEAYQRWCGKTKSPRLDKNGEYIVSCPNPAHPDRNPSARLDPRRDVWNCWGCGSDFGGGVIALAALSFGFEMRPTGQRFHELRRQMAMSMGHNFIQDARGVWQMDAVRTVKAPPKKSSAAVTAPTKTPPATSSIGEQPETTPPKESPSSPSRARETPSGRPKESAAETTPPARDEADLTPAEKLFAGAAERKKQAPEPPVLDEEEQEWLNASMGRPSAPRPASEKARSATADSNSVTSTPPSSKPSPSETTRTEPSSSEKSSANDAPAEAPSPTVTVETTSTPSATSAAPTDNEEHQDDRTLELPNDQIPRFDWRRLIPHETPLRRYLEIVTKDDAPEEYHLMNYLIAIGLACGKNAFLEDEIPVYGNLITCIIGRSGVGKSRSERHIDDLIRKTLPFEQKVWDTDGVKMVRKPGSGEWLAKCFVHETEEPEDPKVSAHHEQADGSQPAVKWKGSGKVEPKMRVNPSVRGLITWPEMSSMIGGKKREGSTIDTAIEVYDVPATLGGGSLTNKEYLAHNPFGSIRTTTQFATLRTLVDMKDASSGFLPRVWFVLGPEKKRFPRGPRIDVTPAMNGLLSIKKWADEKMRDHGGSHNLDDSSPEGTGARFDRFLNDRIYPIQAEGKLGGGSIYNRLDHAYKKMVLLFSANRLEEVVSHETLDIAESFFEWHLKCVNAVSGLLVGGDRAQDEELVLAAVVKHRDELERYPTVRDLYDYSLKRSIDLDRIKFIVHGLVTDHLLEEVLEEGDTKHIRYDLPVD